MYKECSKCGQHKWHNLRRDRKNSPQFQCAECHKAYCRQHLQQNPEYYRERNKKYKGQIKEFVWWLKHGQPCKDCGIRYPHFVLEFDHVSDNKDMNIANIRNFGSIARLQEEILKCELVCSNCHAIRTWTRSQVG